MCGRYAVTLPPEAVRAFFSYVEQPNFPPRYNIAPTQPIPIVTRSGPGGGDDGQRHFRLVRWGFVPSFVKSFNDFRPLVNARSEGIAEKPSFRNAVRRRRCLVIADAFYEWQRRDGGPSQPFLIHRTDGQPFGMAGLFERWMGADGSEIETACIITTAANGQLAGVHDRMPVIVDPGDFDRWLDPDERNVGDALPLLGPAPDDGFDVVPVGPGVNKVANDDASIQEPLAGQNAPARQLPKGIQQGSLF